MPTSIARLEMLLNTLDYPELSIDYSTFRNMSTKCRFVDRDYGEFWAYPSNVLYKRTRHRMRGAAAAALKKRLPLEEAQRRLDAMPNNHLTLDPTTYEGACKRARFVDDEYGECHLHVYMVLNGDAMHPKRGQQKFQAATRISIENVKERIRAIHGDRIELVDSSWTDTGTTATFKHIDHGEWQTSVWSILKGSTHPKEGRSNARQTFRRKYGSDSALGNPHIARKVRRAVKNLVILKHWKTGEDVECTGSFEFGVVSRLNELRIDFQWQIHIQLTNCVYYCDLYVPEWDRFIEIKGYFFPRGKEKWEEFCKQRSNTELWERKRVSEFTGLSIYRLGKLFKKVFSQQAVQLSRESPAEIP